MKIVAVIPARYESTRLPGKPLAMIAGKTMIQRVYEAVKETNLFDEVIVATDDERIMSEVERFSGVACMTSNECRSGTDRVAEALKDKDFGIVVNVQGDEPFITKEPLETLISSFRDPSVMVSSLMTEITAQTDVNNPNCVKVVCDKNSDALYFSRSALPYSRDEAVCKQYRHIGVYAFRKEMLYTFVRLQQSPLEQIEKLEQLRLLENGIKIRMVETKYQGIGIDTPEDLDKANTILSL